MFLSITGTKVNSSIPHSLSKPVFQSNVNCDQKGLTLLDCSYDEPSKTDKIEDVIIRCEKGVCKTHF